MALTLVTSKQVKRQLKKTHEVA